MANENYILSEYNYDVYVYIYVYVLLSNVILSGIYKLRSS